MKTAFANAVASLRKRGATIRPVDISPMLAQLAEAGKLTREDVRDLEKMIEKVEAQHRAERKRKPK